MSNQKPTSRNRVDLTRDPYKLSPAEQRRAAGIDPTVFYHAWVAHRIAAGEKHVCGPVPCTNDIIKSYHVTRLGRIPRFPDPILGVPSDPVWPDGE